MHNRTEVPSTRQDILLPLLTVSFLCLLVLESLLGLHARTLTDKLLSTPSHRAEGRTLPLWTKPLGCPLLLIELLQTGLRGLKCLVEGRYSGLVEGCPFKPPVWFSSEPPELRCPLILLLPCQFISM